MERRKEISGTTRGVQALLLPMFESAFNIDFRASLHALAYQHVTAPCPRGSKLGLSTDATRK